MSRRGTWIAAALGAATLAPAAAPVLRAALPGHETAAQDAKAVPAPDDFGQTRTGVTTHFAQGWPARLISDAKTLGTVSIRDSIAWPQVERSPGRYSFTPANSGHVTRACAAGMTVLLGLEPRNPLYDGGQTAWSPPAQAAFGRYVAAIADHWPGCVIAVEIGNEINGRNGMIGPAALDRPASHTALLKAVHDAVKPRHSGVALLGGSTNMIATGFLERLFRAGALTWVDGIAVHPYRPDPEGVDAELAHLRAVMERFGRARPIWVTEFSRAFAAPADAAPYYLKAIALLEAGGATNHFWYALADQSFYPTMGLERMDGTLKPAALAYAFAARELAPLGPARRVDHGDPTLFDVRFGTDTHVVWGGRRAIEIPAGTRAFAADGTALPLPTEVSDTPVILRGAAGLTFGPPEVLADSLYGYGSAPLRWYIRRAGGATAPLSRLDWQWSSYLGVANMPASAVYPLGIGTGPTFASLARFTPPVDGSAVASVCIEPVNAAASAVASLEQSGNVLWRAIVGAGRTSGAAPVSLRAGQPLDFVISPGEVSRPSRFRYRFRISRTARDMAPCPGARG